jgi:hypothetical protein
MSDVDRRIRDALAAVDQADRPPGFQVLWSRARAEAKERAGRRRAGRLVLVPLLGAVAAAAILLAVVMPGIAPEGGPAGRAASATQGLETLSFPELSSLPSDGLAGAAARADDVDRDLLLAWNERLLGSGTDWLLTLELPAWDRDEERKMP